MIIEAGFDLMFLAKPTVLANDASKRALWVFALDSDMRFWYSTAAIAVLEGSVRPHIDAIISCLDPEYVKYFAIAQYLPRIGEDYQYDYEPTNALKEAARTRGFELLGNLRFDDDMWASTGPTHSFYQYTGGDQFPRAVVIPGPHGCDCACLACARPRALVGHGAV